jgi:hypothetical protein
MNFYNELFDLSSGDEEDIIPNINRYCFHCKEVTEFTFCGNCCKMFCSKHAEEYTEYDDMGWKLYTYLSHKGCL